MLSHVRFGHEFVCGCHSVSQFQVWLVCATNETVIERSPPFFLFSGGVLSLASPSPHSQCRKPPSCETYQK